MITVGGRPWTRSRHHGLAHRRLGRRTMGDYPIAGDDQPDINNEHPWMGRIGPISIEIRHRVITRRLVIRFRLASFPPDTVDGWMLDQNLAILNFAARTGAYETD